MPEPCGGGVDHSSDLGAAVAGTGAEFLPSYPALAATRTPRLAYWMDGQVQLEPGFGTSRSSGTGGFPIGPSRTPRRCSTIVAALPCSSAKASLCCRARACCNSASCGFSYARVRHRTRVLPPRTGTAGGIIPADRRVESRRPVNATSSPTRLAGERTSRRRASSG